MPGENLTAFLKDIFLFCEGLVDPVPLALDEEESQDTKDVQDVVLV